MELKERYDFREAEPRLQARWAALQVFEFNPASGRPVFSVDTPPTTVSGQIHIGHVYSYTQADIAARYHRMRGEEVFYPLGFDDNGLPTERFVERTRGITAREAGRAAFISACLDLSAEVEQRFEVIWKRLGLSMDWRLRYRTIDERSRRLAQAAFLDLLERGLTERREAPALWCAECGTAVAQAEVNDKDDVPATFVTVSFSVGDDREIRIATTRPELLPACVAVFVHPDDRRYQALLGAEATVPLFGHRVPILADYRAQQDKGTGAVMCCTFGDVTDVRWWYEHKLPLRAAVARDGTMNELAGPYAGLRVRRARARVIEDLESHGLLLARQETVHTVGVHERCDTPIEYLVAFQWFVKILEHKERFLAAGREIAWYPPHMHARYESWVANLSWDWNVSRQRRFGVPFPVWYCAGCNAVIVADRERLPVDPVECRPGTPCPVCGGRDLVPETDVMDTWATSSISPAICLSLAQHAGREPGHGQGNEPVPPWQGPMSLRPNAHDIIRTWDFYTIVRSLFHEGRIPWQAVMISGHALNPVGQKISKSKLQTAADPLPTIERFSADAVRYWTAGVRTGFDTVLAEQAMKTGEAFRQGSRLVTKLWNAARFVLLHAGEPVAPVTALAPTDRWLLSRLGRTIGHATSAFDQYEISTARAAAEGFFWSDFCDTYLELVKHRVTHAPATGSCAAAQTLRAAFLAVLKMLAPFVPHVAEEIYLEGFAGHEGAISIHLSPWPDARAYPIDEKAEQLGRTILSVVDAVRRWKAERSLSVGAPIAGLSIVSPPAQMLLLGEIEQDLRSITRAGHITVSSGGSLEVVPF